MPHKKLILPLLLIALCSSCSSIKLIGTLNMLSNRNVNMESGNYELKSPYQGSGKTVIRRKKYKSIEEAADATVKMVPGGEFLLNVKIWQLGDRFAVEGDVWGAVGKFGDSNLETMKGFKVGDLVQFENGFAKKRGTIISIIDADKCMVQEDGETVGQIIKYEKIVKIDLDINSTNNQSNNSSTTTTVTTNTTTDNTNNAECYTYNVGCYVNFASNKYTPKENFKAKIISLDELNKKMTVEYLKNDKTKTETISYDQIIK